MHLGTAVKSNRSEAQIAEQEASAPSPAKAQNLVAQARNVASPSTGRTAARFAFQTTDWSGSSEKLKMKALRL